MQVHLVERVRGLIPVGVKGAALTGLGHPVGESGRAPREEKKKKKKRERRAAAERKIEAERPARAQPGPRGVHSCAQMEA